MGLLRRVARARLAAQVIRRLRRAGITDARYHTRDFEIRFSTAGEDVPTIVQLEPLLAARGRGRRERRARLDAFVAGFLHTPGMPTQWEQAAPLLRPVLRAAAPGAPLRRPAMPFLSEFVVVDQPETMTYVTAEQSAVWGVRADRVFATARRNLTAAVLHGAASQPVVVQFVDDGDAYWTSHLLLEGWLARLAEQVGGVPVAFAPERGTLLVTADGSGHLPGLFARAEEIFAQSPRALTPMAYVSDEQGCTVPYPAPPGHPLHRTVQRAERVLAVHEYTRQAAGPATGRRFAELELLGSDETGWRTRTVWEPGPPVLLPVADEVVTGDRTLPWTEVEPRLTRADGYTPARWLTG